MDTFIMMIYFSLEEESYKVEAVLVVHRVPCFAFVIKEKDLPGR